MTSPYLTRAPRTYAEAIRARQGLPIIEPSRETTPLVEMAVWPDKATRIDVSEKGALWRVAVVLCISGAVALMIWKGIGG